MPVSREQLASTGSKSRAKRGGKTAQASTVTDALGPAPRTVVLKGREFVVQPLDFNDLVQLETDRGSLGEFIAEVTGLRLEAIRYFFWLLFRKSVPEITLAETGTLIPIEEVAMAELLVQMLSAAGLTESNPGNGKTPAATPSTGV